jgi:hypothetical protein
MPLARLLAGAFSMLAAMLAVAPAAAEPTEQIGEAPHIRQAVEAAIDPDTRRGVTRLPRVTLDATGDATVVLALRNEDDDPEATYAAALDDTLRVLRAVYHSADADRISSVTVVGTFNVISATGRARELPVLRAVISAEHAAQLDWAALGPDEVPQLADVWWVHAGFHGREAMVDGG